MDGAFRPLAEMLRAVRDGGAAASAAAVEPNAARVPLASVRTEAPSCEACRSIDAQAREIVPTLALARLAALEAYDRAARRLLEAFARDLLARELATADVDIAALAVRASEAFAADEPVRLIAAPDDAERLPRDLPVASDPALRPGDLIVEVRDGTIDLRLDVRMREALDGAWT